MICPSECNWVSPDVRPYSQAEELQIRTLAQAQRMVMLRDECRRAGAPWPPPVARFHIITTRRHTRRTARG